MSSLQVTAGQVRALPCAHEQVVPSDFADANGHMNIVRYMQLHNDAAWKYMHHFGLGEEHAADSSAGSFEVEQHLRYLREVHVGDVVAVHVRMLGRSEKALHVMQFLVNVSRNELANTFESLSLSVDMATRKVVPYPPHVADLLDARLRIDQALDWPVPVVSAMGPR
ncbi:MAG TPA: thioesterase family protein [Intrasporangium sp.]|uniref:thioesterase family protein n=1 Tax=Intrasporangium sp. TaxID=1925024 RepID=UPI002D7A0A5B|nr:thioesterase family protein [Intrasporangium sp.]HET7399864.1 thioesterase family protein [Intrasporangium sp.]